MDKNKEIEELKKDLNNINKKSVELSDRLRKLEEKAKENFSEKKSDNGPQLINFTNLP